MTPTSTNRTELEHLVDRQIEQMHLHSTNDVDEEDALMSYFDPLFFILADGNAIERLSAYLSQIAALSLQRAKHQDLLCYYQGIVARDKQEFDKAEQMFQALLAVESTEPFLRARILNALGILYDFSSRFDAALKAYQDCAEAYQRIGDKNGEGKALKNQGIVLLELGEYRQASTQLLRAQEIFQQANNKILQGRVLLELGYTERECGNWESARNHYQAGMQIAQSLVDQDMIARFSNNLGSLYCFIGDWEAAEAHHQRALALVLHLPENEQREVADIYHNLGFLAMVQGQLTQAQGHYESALTFALEAQELTAISEIYYRLGNLWEQKAAHQQAYTAYARGIEAVEQMFGQVGQEAVRISVMGIRQQLYQAMVLCCLTLARVDEAFSYVQRAKSRAFLDLLGRSHAKSVKYEHHPLSASLIQAGLPEGSVLIEYFATGHAGVNQEMLNKLPSHTQFLCKYVTPPEQMLVFVVNSRAIEVATLPITARQLEARHFQRRNGRLRGTDPVAKQPLSSLHWWHQLDQQLIEPIRHKLGNYQHLFFAPHGTLHYVPLHALAASGQLLTDVDLTVSYIPSASVLLQGVLTDATKVSTTVSDSFAPHEKLAIGVDLAGLTHSEAEATRIAKQLQGTMLVGAEATINNVCRQLPSAKIIHFSCHGLFHHYRAMTSALQLADGLLTAADILQSVQLEAEMITLSACDTGLNPLAHGDELMGFTRALLGAGTRTLLMALWQVLELPTRLFMEQFYQAWLNGASGARALVAAQQALRSLTVDELRKQLMSYDLPPEEVNRQISQFVQMCPGNHPFNHPYYWGAFIIVGDPG